MSDAVDEEDEEEEDWEEDLSREFNHLNCRAVARLILGAAQTWEEDKSTVLLVWADQAGWLEWFNTHHCVRCGTCSDQLNDMGLCGSCQGRGVLAA